MAADWPQYLSFPAERLGADQPVAVRVLEDQKAVARDMAAVMLACVRKAAEAGRAATMIVPVGPVDQYPLLAEKVNRHRTSLRDVMLINMDEYLGDDECPVPVDHPLSFTGYVQRMFYDRLDPELAPRPENRVFPDPARPELVAECIDRRGGVDVCFGGIGINGHLAFNEPPEPGQSYTVEDFAALPTRVLELSRETRTINSVTVGGEISIVPRRAVTVGMREILAARRLRFYCNRQWQCSVVRRALHGPLTPACPASFLRTHEDAMLTVAAYVAEPPDIRLR